VLNFLDRIRLEGAAFAIEQGFFEWAEKMLRELSSAASASSAAATLRQRIRDTEIVFWQKQSRFASAVADRFPHYLPGRLYADLCYSRRQNCNADSALFPLRYPVGEESQRKLFSGKSFG